MAGERTLRKLVSEHCGNCSMLSDRAPAGRLPGGVAPETHRACNKPRMEKSTGTTWVRPENWCFDWTAKVTPSEDDEEKMPNPEKGDCN